MNQDSAEPRSDGGTPAQRPPPREVKDNPLLVFCRCGHPMHPDHLEKRRGVMMERYSCPQRRWWNALHHPHAWMAPRES